MRSPLVLGDGGQFRQQPGWQVATLTGVTTDKSTWVTLLTEGQPLTIPDQSAWLFNARVLASGVSGTGGFELDGVVKRVGSVTLVGSKDNTIASDSNSLKVRVVEDSGNDALAIQVKGINNAEIQWSAVMMITSIPG